MDADVQLTLVALLGALTLVHEVPSQCWKILPTAQQSVADTHVTAERE